MPCFQPLAAWPDKYPTRTGKRALVFSEPYESARAALRLSIPCGSCAGCRLDQARDWAVRCIHESQLHNSTCFLTLTYDREHLPLHGTLVLEHLQLFFKALRNWLVRSGSSSRATTSVSSTQVSATVRSPSRPLDVVGSAGVRYFACGEYGESMSRPHYHVLLFGFSFPDRVQFGRRESPSGPVVTYVSSLLRELWPRGHSLIGDVTPASCNYVAGYVQKKRRADAEDDHRYDVVDSGTGEVVARLRKEFTVSSRRPGIGAGWIDRYKSEVFGADRSGVVVDGREVAVPRFYVERVRRADVLLHERHVRLQRRLVERIRRSPDATARRLRDRLTVLEARMKMFAKRRFEHGE